MSTDAAGLYRLMAWLSPSYPVGAFTLSHGLEWEVEEGTVGDVHALVAWVEDVLAHGAGRQDAILLAAAWRARRAEVGRVSEEAAPHSAHSGNGGAELTPSSAHSRESGNPWGAGYETPRSAEISDGSAAPAQMFWRSSPTADARWSPAFAGMSGVSGQGGGQLGGESGDESEAVPALSDIVELAAALNPSKERRTETISQGEAFKTITETAWPAARPWPEGPLAYPVAVAIAAADHGVGLSATLTAYLHAFAANIVSAGVRLIPLGQSDGQRAIARLEHPIAKVAAAAHASTLDDLGGFALLADIASMRHETQYTRLFRT